MALQRGNFGSAKCASKRIERVVVMAVVVT